MTALEIANSMSMWILALLTVGIAIFQAIIFAKKTLKFNKENRILAPNEIKRAIRTGGIVSLGPALSVFVLAISMIATIGAPVTLMRVGIIGSVSTELMAANIGTELVGVTLGKDILTPEALATALFAMASMSLGYLIFVPFLTRGLGKRVLSVITPGENNKNNKMATFFGMIFPILVYALLVLAQVSGSIENTLTLIFAIVFMMILDGGGRKMNWKWMGEWSMGLTVLVSMVFGTCLHLIIGG